jgi:ribose 5-phosphate isomerase
VSSGGGHTAEEVVDLMREREERSSSPSSREDELECPRDSIFIQSLENVAVVEEDGGPTRDGHFILDLHFNQGESAV